MKRIRDEIAAGTYDSDEKLTTAMYRLLVRLRQRMGDSHVPIA